MYAYNTIQKIPGGVGDAVTLLVINNAWEVVIGNCSKLVEGLIIEDSDAVKFSAKKKTIITYVQRYTRKYTCILL